tara:strand:- start:1284 stop:1475 length:192 start_codon:yes stop_codon:yes gene_type:complete
MTDKNKYSNISVSKRTYADLQKLAKEILPGRTSLSISKTVDVLVNEKIQQEANVLTKGDTKND